MRIAAPFTQYIYSFRGNWLTEGTTSNCRVVVRKVRPSRWSTGRKDTVMSSVLPSINANYVNKNISFT